MGLGSADERALLGLEIALGLEQGFGVRVWRRDLVRVGLPSWRSLRD